MTTNFDRLLDALFSYVIVVLKHIMSPNTMVYQNEHSIVILRC